MTEINTPAEALNKSIAEALQTSIAEALQTSIAEALKKWPAWCSEKPKLVKQLGGSSNHNFLISAKNDQFVLRINNPMDHLGVDRIREHDILGLISKLSYSPELIYWHKDYLLTRFIQTSSHADDSLYEIAKVFQRIHLTPCNIGPAFDTKKHLENYIRQIKKPDRQLSLCFEKAMKLNPLYRETCLCHHDLLEANILKTDNGIKVIDWEYAQPGNPLFDIAVYAESNLLNERQTRELLDAYDSELWQGQKTSTASLEEHRLLYLLTDILWRIINAPQQDISQKLDQLELRLQNKP